MMVDKPAWAMRLASKMLCVELQQMTSHLILAIKHNTLAGNKDLSHIFVIKTIANKYKNPKYLIRRMMQMKT